MVLYDKGGAVISLLDWLEKRRVLIGSLATIAIVAVGMLLAWIDWHPPKSELITKREVIKEQTVPIVQSAVSDQASATTVASQPVSNASRLININSATVAELDVLPGIGKAYAERIIEYRGAHGGFKNAQDLLNVKGIGQATYAKIKDLVTVGGN